MDWNWGSTIAILLDECFTTYHHVQFFFESRPRGCTRKKNPQKNRHGPRRWADLPTFWFRSEAMHLGLGWWILMNVGLMGFFHLIGGWVSNVVSFHLFVLCSTSPHSFRKMMRFSIHPFHPSVTTRIFRFEKESRRGRLDTKVADRRILQKPAAYVSCISMYLSLFVPFKAHMFDVNLTVPSCSRWL